MKNVTLNTDALSGLKQIPDEYVNTCVTSPPYWALRDYGIDGQIGLEKTPEEYIEIMIQIFKEVKRVLKKDGTLWLNMGDSYAAAARNRTDDQVNGITSTITGNKNQLASAIQPNTIIGDLKPKDMVGIPWMLAFALRADGWYLRQDIIWHKPNPMPESVTDRCTKAHEYIFLLSKSKQYYYDAEAIKEPASNNTHARRSRVKDDHKSIPDHKKNGIRPRKLQSVPSGWDTGKTNHNGKKGRYPKVKDNLSFDAALSETVDKRNKRSVWTVLPEAFPDAHFATYPQKLITDCIKAGCPPGGIVLDPFHGSGTTGIVANKLERNFIAIELNPTYIEIEKKRRKKELGIFAPESVEIELKNRHKING